MAKLLGIVGKPNCGKSTFLNAATLATAEIANYPFTTIEPNRGIAYVRAPCPCKEFGVECNPNNSECRDGTRYIPIEMLDVAGLVPGAHEGKGLGNKFLDDLRQADALIHVIDASGSTDSEGKPCSPGEHNPEEDITFLENELDLWFLALIKKDWEAFARKLQMEKGEVMKALVERFSGLKVKEHYIGSAVRELGLDIEKPSDWNDDDLKRFATKLREFSKQILICANKCDIPEAEKFLPNLEGAIPTSADSELALRRAAEKGILKYDPGSDDFEIIGDVEEAQKKALEFIKEKVLKKFNGTGVQKAIDKAVFEMLNLIVVYPVEDENKYEDKKGCVLPDAHLIPKGTTAREFAYKIHTDIGKNFVCGIDARTKKKVGADYELKSGDVISIHCSK
ncbi:MAG: redox-regulated ATPase YchF [archaeon]